MSHTAKRWWIRPVIVLSIVLAVGAAVVVADRQPAVDVDGCALGPTHPQINPETHSGSFTFPYGDVKTCRELSRRGHRFGSVDTTEVLLLDTEKGLVVVRLEITDWDHARQWKASAYEVAPDDVPPGLSDDEMHRLKQAVSDRHGVQNEAWVFRYGDG